MKEPSPYGRESHETQPEQTTEPSHKCRKTQTLSRDRGHATAERHTAKSPKVTYAPPDWNTV